MAETKLVLTFGVSGGGETTLTLSDAKTSLTKEVIGPAMDAMVAAECFATSKGQLYTDPIAAEYVTTTSSSVFDNGNEETSDDYVTA